METLTLKWHGPYKFEELLKDPELERQFSCPGVYLWKENNSGNEGIAYIGKAGGSPTLFKRHLQHYMGYLGGTYSIPKEFRRSSKEWVLNLKKDEVVSTIFDLSKFKGLVEEGFEYTKHLSIYMAKAPKEKTADIERNLLYSINPTRTQWGTKSKPDVAISINHTGDLSNDKLQRQNNC